MKTSKNNNGFRQHQLVIAEAASPERCLRGAGLYEVRIATEWHRAKGMIHKRKSAFTSSFLRHFALTSPRRFIRLYANLGTSYRVAVRWIINLKAVRILWISVKPVPTSLRKSLLSVWMFCAFWCKHQHKECECGSAQREPHTRKVKTRLNI